MMASEVNSCSGLGLWFLSELFTKTRGGGTSNFAHWVVWQT